MDIWLAQYSLALALDLLTTNKKAVNLAPDDPPEFEIVHFYDCLEIRTSIRDAPPNWKYIKVDGGACLCVCFLSRIIR